MEEVALAGGIAPKLFPVDEAWWWARSDWAWVRAAAVFFLWSTEIVSGCLYSSSSAIAFIISGGGDAAYSVFVVVVVVAVF